MARYAIYRLTFKSPLHLGRASGAAQQSRLGLEKTDIYIRADLLFSAICEMWTHFYDTESLTAFLNPYTQDASVLPLTLTSAFPFADNVYFFPKPQTYVNPSEKQSKGVQFVSAAIFHDILSGTPPAFNTDDIINAGKVWIGRDEKQHLKNTIDAGNRLWETNIRPRVTIGSRNAGSEIWHIETVDFNTGCGLWFAARFDTQQTQQKFETLLKVLADTGIGGERNAGYGMFAFHACQKMPLELPTAENCDAFVTLSPICPKSPAQLGSLMTGDSAYTLNLVESWRGRAEESRPYRKSVYLFMEGSVLRGGQEHIGRLVDLSREGAPHPIYRYGYAWQVGIKGVSA